MAEGVRDDVNVCRLCGALENLSMCGGCRRAWYCSKAHQKEDWKAHKPTCKRMNGSCAEGQTASSPPNNCDCEESSSTRNHKANETSAKSLMTKQRQCCGSNIMPNQEDSQDSDTEIQNEETANTFVTDPTNANMSRSPSPMLSLNQQDLLTFSSLHSSDSGHGSNPKSSNGSLDQSTGGCEGDQLLTPQRPATQTTSSRPTSKTSNKKREVKSEGRSKSSNSSLSAEAPVQERYYLNEATHQISLPSSTNQASLSFSSASAASGMGKGDRCNDTLSANQTREQYLLVLQSRFKEVAKYVVQCLTRYGICVLDKFLGDATGQDILKEVLHFEHAGIMKQGQLVHGPTSSKNKRIRGDMITWVDGSENCCENIHFLISCMDAVLLQCTSKLKTCKINERTKAMVACYPGGGTGYVRHVDNPNGDGRCITCIYYLNKDWDVRVSYFLSIC